MRSYRNHGAAVALFALLSGCSAAPGLFSYDTAPDPPPARDAAYRSCAYVAAQRADDAVLAGYAEEASADKKEIYDKTYRACATWQRAH
jgi:hypothetical protein